MWSLLSSLPVALVWVALEDAVAVLHLHAELSAQGRFQERWAFGEFPYRVFQEEATETLSDQHTVDKKLANNPRY